MSLVMLGNRLSERSRYNKSIVSTQLNDDGLFHRSKDDTKILSAATVMGAEKSIDLYLFHTTTFLRQGELILLYTKHRFTAK